MHVIISTNLPEVAAALTRAGENAAVVIAADMQPLADEVAVEAVSWIRGDTPVRTGKLRDSTIADTLVSPTSATIGVAQPALTEADQSGRWGGKAYVEYVVGGRGPVRPIYKQALAGPGFGPVKYAGPAAPNPYPETAMESAAPAILDLVALHGERMAAKIASLL